MILIVLASGRGSRLKKETSKKPKCLIKINDKTILENLEKIFVYFNKVIIVSGYKYKLIKKKYSSPKIKVIVNKKFRSTNMVYSLFLANKFVNSDVVVTYGDIFFDESIIKRLIKIKKTVLDKVIKYYESLDKSIYYDGKDYDNMYMTSFIQMIIDNLEDVNHVYINSGWVEIDSVEDLKALESVHESFGL